jgi:putative FmdB family regulatory protein
MPLYEFRCEKCGAREEVFVRSVTSEVKAPACTACKGKPAMVRAMSKFARHLTEADQVAEAEAKWGKEVDAAMGPGPDVGRYTRRYDRLAKDLPPPEDLGPPPKPPAPKETPR